MAICIAVASCSINGYHGNGDDNYYSRFVTIPGAEWDYTNTLEMDVDTLRDSIASGGPLVLVIKHSQNYAYSNLWLELSYPLNDSVAVTDTFDISLADPAGAWIGRSLGAAVEKTDTLYPSFTIRRKMPLKIRHIMRLDRLDGIEQAGLIYYPGNEQ